MAETTATSAMETDEIPVQQFVGVVARVPTLGDRVYKDECTYCFGSAFNDAGLLISTASFLAVCPKHVPWFLKFEDNTGFVRYRKIKQAVPESNEPSAKIQKLSINVAPETTIEEYTVVVYPNLDKDLHFDNLPAEIRESATSIASHITAALQDTLAAGAWDGEQRQISENALTLKQAQNPIKLPSSGWKCGEFGCGLTENLWLNLTDGAIRCGRNQVTNTGETLPGNGHARDYFSLKGYPIAVKLGTISNGDADIFDYKLDDSCIDPKLAEHLAHFGLDINALEKTEKSTLEMELDLNQKWEWSRCCEDGVSLESVFGPGFTGIINIGSSCYINSVLQILSLTKNFTETYGEKAEQILRNMSPAEINSSFNAQMAKVVAAMQSGEYAVAGSKHNGFEPKIFRKVVGQGHAEFATGRQQDAEEYMRHLFSKFDQYTPNESANPVDAFRFKCEVRLQDHTNHVRYTEREDTILSLPVPLDQAEDVGGSQNRKVIALEKCLEAAFTEEIVENFESPITKERGNARTSTSMKTFPDYLVLQVRRFGYNDDFTVKKLDVDVLLDEVINLERFASKGPQPGEKLLPEDVNAEFVPHVNEEFVQSLVSMGINENAARKSVYVTNNASAESATEWFFNHMDDADINEVHRDLVRGSGGSSRAAAPASASVNNTQIDDLVALGFPAHKAKHALNEANGNVNEAANWLFMNADSLPDTPPPEAPAEVVRDPEAKEFRNGRAVYRLVGVISHMGTSPFSGHYVAHVKRDDTWYLFNDEKVAISQNPPISLGYLYLLERKPE